MSYWTGSNWFTLYSADRHDEECGCDNGTCASPQPVYITGSGLSYPQDCTHPTYPCSIVALYRGQGAIKSKVPWNYVPGTTEDPAKLRPHFVTAVTPTQLFRGYLKFEPGPGKPPITAMVFRYLVPQHNHDSDPHVPRPPKPNAPRHDCDERIIAFGFELDVTGAPVPLPGNPVSARFVVRDGDLYHVRAGGSTYGIVTLARP